MTEPASTGQQVIERLRSLARVLPSEAETLTQAADLLEQQAREIDRLQRECRIRDLATPLEDDLSQRIDDMCKHLAMEDGFTLNGIARLFIETQKRMAADWLEIGSLRRRVKETDAATSREAALREEIERLKAFLEQTNLSANHAEAVVDRVRTRAESAEAALAAVRACVGELEQEVGAEITRFARRGLDVESGAYVRGRLASLLALLPLSGRAQE